MSIHETILKSASPRRYIILEEKPNPSTDYFVMPWLREQCLIGSEATTHPFPIAKLSWGQDIPDDWLDGACVVIVRYLTAQWRRTLQQNRNRLSDLVYFFDDDIPDFKASQGLPLKYRAKLYLYGARHFKWLIQQNAQLYVSTPYLQNKYQAHNPIVLTPQQITSPTTHSTNTQKIIQDNAPLDPATTIKTHKIQKRCRVFYHATASHRQEIEWLYPVMKQVLETSPHVDFEIIGDAKTRSLYKNLPRTTIFDPMSWTDYQSFIALPGRDIGLAPHLDSPFNRARSYTKLFDINRAGATAILADNGPWANINKPTNIASDTSNQLILVPMHKKNWVKAIQGAAKRITGD